MNYRIFFREYLDREGGGVCGCEKAEIMMKRMQPVLAPAVMLLALAAAQASETLTVSLDFHTQALDLDNGVVMEASQPLEAAGADIRLAYNALRSPHAVIVPAGGDGAELAFVQDVAFDGITADSISSLSFSPEAVDLPFSASDTVVVRTAAGAVFKLGNASESGQSVTFNFSRVL